MLNRTTSGRFRCDRCGVIVDELPVIPESRPFGSTEVYEDVIDDDCSCGGKFEEVNHKCKRCDEYCTDEEYDYEMCPICRETVIHDISTYLKENYTKNELDCFAEDADALIDLTR